MDLGIKNKRVLISGASNGIGKELAYQFAKEDCRLTLLSRNKVKLQNILNDIGGEKKGHHFFSVDLLPKGNATNISKKILKNIGIHDIIVHCVGGGLGVDNPFAEYKDYLKVWRFNVGIAIEINNVFVKSMFKRKWGRVIHVSSVASTIVDPDVMRIAYSSSKAYLNHKSLFKRHVIGCSKKECNFLRCNARCFSYRRKILAKRIKKKSI